METLNNNVRKFSAARRSPLETTKRAFRVEGGRFDAVELETCMTGRGEEILQIRLFQGERLVHLMKYDIPTHKLVFVD